jgi:conjugative transfer region protein TrbK
MNTQNHNCFPSIVAVAIVGLLVAACTIPLRSGEEQARIVEPNGTSPDPLARKLAECRSVTSEQKDALIECRKVWAEKRREFLGQKTPGLPDAGPRQSGSPLFVAPRDESRRPPDAPPIPEAGKE